MGTLLFFFVISIAFSFLCSILEAVLLSVTPTFVNRNLAEGKSFAKKLAELKADVDKPLIAILTLNTFAHTIGAIGVGAQAEAVFGGGNSLILPIVNIPIPVMGIVSTVMTLAILIASEIIPKTIGANYWKSLARFSTFTLNIMVFIMKWTGALFILQLFTRLVGKKKKNIFSRADLQAMASLGLKQGVFQQEENVIISNLIKFPDASVQEIFTPRTVVIAAEQETNIHDFYMEHPKLRFSRIPIYDKTIDNVTGYILKDDLLTSIIQGNQEQPLKSIQRKMVAVSEHVTLPALFNIFLKQREQIGLVVDDYGGMEGIVTLEDIIEHLLGREIVDERDTEVDLRATAREEWKKRADEQGLELDEVESEETLDMLEDSSDGESTEQRSIEDLE